MNISKDQVMSVFVTVSDVFPGLQNDYETLKTLLEGIDRNSALVTCAQINLVLSDPMNDNEERGLGLEQSRLRRQQMLVPLFFTQAEAERLNAFAEQHRPTEPIVFSANKFLS